MSLKRGDLFWAERRGSKGVRAGAKGMRRGAPVTVRHAHGVEVAQHVAAADAALQVGVLDEREKEVGCGYVPHAGVASGLDTAVHRDAAAADSLQKLF